MPALCLFCSLPDKGGLGRVDWFKPLRRHLCHLLQPLQIQLAATQ